MKMLRELMRNPSAVLGIGLLILLILISIIGPFFTQSPYEQDTSKALEKPSAEHILGTDEVGRDVLARLVLGARYSLSAGIFAVALGLIGGLFLGCIAGYYGGILDRAIMSLCDILLAFPGILLAMAIVMVMNPGVFTPMIAVGISSVPTFARLVRAFHVFA